MKTLVPAAVVIVAALTASAAETVLPLNVSQLEINPCTKEPMVLRLNGEIRVDATSAANASRYHIQIHARGTSYGQNSGAQFAVESESSRTLHYGGPQTAFFERQPAEFVEQGEGGRKFRAAFLYRLVLDEEGRLTGSIFSASYVCRR